ncbi:hippocalcin-like protein 1 [Babylonia areolata]|uniref:hippocalcin-like protein 1 n=1 Tax=Babylonia areolata TaxID=304850 RepID=UPI003FD2505C
MGQNAAKSKLPDCQVRKLRRQVSFTEEEIRDWYKDFVKSSSKGRDDLFLTEQEFVKVYNSVYPGESAEFARHVYRTFDLDHDGRVDFREFLIGLSFSGSSDLEKRLGWAFRVYDVDNSGYITIDEMRQIVQSVFRMMGPSLVGGEAQSADSLAEEIFRQMDTDGDQRISWQEFHDGASKHPTVLQLLQCGPPAESEPLADN